MLIVQLDQMMIIDVITRWGNVLLFRAPHWLVDMLSPEQSLTRLDNCLCYFDKEEGARSVALQVSSVIFV